MQRKLTAILSADVVGFSGLMEADEAGTLALDLTLQKRARRAPVRAPATSKAL